MGSLYWIEGGIKGSRKTKKGGEEGQRGPHIDGTMGFKGVGEGYYKNMIEVKGEAYIFILLLCSCLNHNSCDQDIFIT